MTPPPPGDDGRVPVWDAPTRLFHWTLVLLIAFSWWSAEARKMDWHRYSGYGVLALVTFRIFWGFAGSSTARFSGFVRSPAAAVRYLRGRADPSHGHNPLGAWSVVAMLLLLVAQVGLGLFAVDIDGIESGPLADRVSFDVGRVAAEWHHRSFNALLALIALHVAAIAVYLVVRRENLITPMLTGLRLAAAGQQAMRRGSPVALVAGVALAAFLAWAVARGFHF